MKTLKLALTVLLSATIVSDAVAQGEVERRRSILKQWVEKKRDDRRTGAAAEGVTSKLDVPYLDDQEPLHRLDVYIPVRKEKPLTVLVHIHGGGWEIGDKSMMRGTGLFYASHGVLFVTPNYRLSPKAQHPAHAEDCAAAVAWAFRHVEELGGDRRRVFLSGHSAGAHLAALLATDPAFLQKHGIKPAYLAGVIPVDAASYDLADDDNELVVKKLIRDSFGSDPAVLNVASPLHHVSADARYPDFLILNTMNRASAAKGGRLFADKLKGAGCSARFVSVDNHTHAEMATGMYDLSDPVGSAIFAFLFPASKE
ncbi:MAG TPA: alpha/beta hydrolase [Verrucomicrobiae bacterium]|nr:alpha/beta hydrolase [Verrucomicrobiae bacterium]